MTELTQDDEDLRYEVEVIKAEIKAGNAQYKISYDEPLYVHELIRIRDYVYTPLRYTSDVTSWGLVTSQYWDGVSCLPDLDPFSETSYRVPLRQSKYLTR